MIGAGIAGLGCARHLAQKGKRVVLLEQNEPGSAASGVNAGTLAYQNKREPLLAFYREALEEWARLRHTLGEIGHGQPGGLHVASATERAELERVSLARAAIGEPVEWLEGRKLRTRAPWLGPEVDAATYCGRDGYANPQLACLALAAECRRAGVTVVSRARVRGAALRNRRHALDTSAGDFEAEAAVIAAGPWSAGVASLFGRELGVGSSLIVLSVTEPAPSFIDAVVTHVSGRLTLKRLANDSVLIGGGWPGKGRFEPYEPGIDAASLQHNLRYAAAIVPALAEMRLVRAWAGFESVTRDGLPILAALGGEPMLVACVPTAAGLTAGPLMGRLAGELVLGKALPEYARPFARGS